MVGIPTISCIHVIKKLGYLHVLTLEGVVLDNNNILHYSITVVIGDILYYYNYGITDMCLTQGVGCKFFLYVIICVHIDTLRSRNSPNVYNEMPDVFLAPKQHRHVHKSLGLLLLLIW